MIASIGVAAAGKLSIVPARKHLACQTKLLHVAQAGSVSRVSPGPRKRWEQNRNQQGNDGHNDQNLD
jgi:hypothetical protein